MLLLNQKGRDIMTDNELLLAMSDMLEPIRNDIQGMKDDIQGVQQEQRRLTLLLENDVIPRLQNIESCYTSTYDRYKNSVEDYETMKQDIAILKKVVAEHSEKLQKIS